MKADQIKQALNTEVANLAAQGNDRASAALYRFVVEATDTQLERFREIILAEPSDYALQESVACSPR